jgi:hypothetical protein
MGKIWNSGIACLAVASHPLHQEKATERIFYNEKNPRLSAVENRKQASRPCHFSRDLLPAFLLSRLRLPFGSSVSRLRGFTRKPSIRKVG